MEYKGYDIVTGNYSFKIIRSIGSGALPKKLHGDYTSVGAAMKAIDLYINGKKVNTNGKAIRSSRDK